MHFLVVMVVASVALGVPSSPTGNQLNSAINGRIVGGEETDISNYPYQLSLMYLQAHYCGAALISSNWALTAAHCTTSNSTPHFYSIRYGSSIRDSGGSVVEVSKVIIHDKYNHLTMDYDFSLLQLATPIVSSSEVPASVIELASEDFSIDDDKIVTVTGWGALSSNGNAVCHLQVVNITISNFEDCNTSYGYDSVTDRMFCAGLVTGGKDVCLGDGGGPAVIDGVLAGVVSWGYDCGLESTPGVYASVPSVREWIKENTGV